MARKKKNDPRDGKQTVGNRTVYHDPDLKRLSRTHQALVIRWIGEYKTTSWIVRELKQRFGLTREPNSIDIQYRYGKRFQEQIQSWRKRFNDGLMDEAFASRRFTLQALRDCYDLAMDQKDPKAAVAVIKQACEMMGHNQPLEIEVNHVNGDMSFEERLAAIFETEKANAITVEAHTDEPLALPDTLQVDSLTTQAITYEHDWSAEWEATHPTVEPSPYTQPIPPAVDSDC